MSGEGFPIPELYTEKDQITFDDLEQERVETEGAREIEESDGSKSLIPEMEKSDPRALAIESIQNAEEFDDLRNLAIELNKNFNGDEELEEVFNNRKKTIKRRNVIVTSLPFGKKYDDLKSCFERTKNDPDFTEADKRQIYIAIKNNQ